MKPIANQKKITVVKETVEKDSGKKRPYMIAYVDTIEKAAKDLKNSAFKVYIYILSNQNDFYFGLSPQDISNRYGISIDAARDGIKQLIDKGYIVAENEMEYTFYDSIARKPVELPDDICEELETKSFVNKRTGETVKYTYKQILEMAKGDEEKARRVWEGA